MNLNQLVRIIISALEDIKASDIHQRTPFFIGSKNMMKKAISFLS